MGYTIPRPMAWEKWPAGTSRAKGPVSWPSWQTVGPLALKPTMGCIIPRPVAWAMQKCGPLARKTKCSRTQKKTTHRYTKRDCLSGQGPVSLLSPGRRPGNNGTCERLGPKARPFEHRQNQHASIARPIMDLFRIGRAILANGRAVGPQAL